MKEPKDGLTQLLNAHHWVKVRSSLDPARSTFLVWRGSIYAFLPNEPRKRLFKMVGMSVSRCLPVEENTWAFTSRELTYYLDPTTEEKLETWKNPWTEAMLPVMHVANNPVQGIFKGQFPAQIDNDMTTFVFDIFPAYSNPLADDPKFAEYSPNPDYQAAELFKFVVPTADIFDEQLPSVSKLWLSWDRIGPWVPWMKMGDRAGHLIYSASGHKVNDFEQLPQLLKDEIHNRMTLYRHAPEAPLDGEDMTSWLYFQQHFAAYLAGATFPIPASGPDPT